MGLSEVRGLQVTKCPLSMAFFSFFLSPWVKFLSKRLSQGSEILHGALNEKCSHNFAPPDMWAKKIPLVSMGGPAEGHACADPGARTPIDAIGKFIIY